MQDPQRGLIQIPHNPIHSIINWIKQNEVLDQIVKYYGMSLVSCAVNLGSRIILNFIFSFVESVFLSSIIGGIANFILVKYYVFHSRKNISKELFLYCTIAVFGVLFITALSAGFDKIFIQYHIFIVSQNITYFIIQLISLGINSLVGFFLCKYIVFRGSSCKHKID